MTVIVKIEIETERFEAAMEKAPARMRKAILDGLRRSSEVVVKKARKNLQRGKTPTGALRGSIWYKLDERNLISFIGPGMIRKASKEFGDPANYGFFVEFGRRPGGIPPRAPIKAWTRKVLGLSGADLNRVSRAIQVKISKAGVPPNPYLVPALNSSIDGINRAFNREIERAVAEIDGEASR